jgi:hypothetical protein
MTTLHPLTPLQRRAALPTAGLALSTDQVALRKLPRAAALAGLAAAAGNLAVFGLARGLLNLPLVMPPVGPLPGGPLPAFQVIVASLGAVLGAALVLALLGRLTARPVLAFQVMAGAFLVASLIGPLRQPVDLATKLTLLSMHLVTGLVVTAVLSSLAKE